jgi:hypothetical protein
MTRGRTEEASDPAPDTLPTDRPLARGPGSLPALQAKPMNPQDWKLILLALIAITALIVLITKAKVNAFLSLLIASLVVGLGAVLLLDVPIRDTTGKVLTSPEGKTAAYTVLGVMKSFGDGLGATLAGTAGVIALGTSWPSPAVLKYWPPEWRESSAPNASNGALWRWRWRSA